MFKDTVKQAKREYWRRNFSEVKSDADMYHLAQWAKLRLSKEPAPTRIATTLELDPERRAILLRGMLLARYMNENDLVESDEEENENLNID